VGHPEKKPNREVAPADLHIRGASPALSREKNGSGTTKYLKEHAKSGQIRATRGEGSSLLKVKGYKEVVKTTNRWSQIVEKLPGHQF